MFRKSIQSVLQAVSKNSLIAPSRVAAVVNTTRIANATLIGNVSSSSSTQSGFSFTSLATGAALAATAAVASTGFSSECAGTEAKADSETDPFADTALYPPITAYEKGFLKVSNIHTIAYSLYGNPHGKPVLFVHGGPGGGTHPGMARYFDPKVYKIILVDQRGCGDSTPFANLEDNTTYDSVRDFEKLRVKLGIKKWQVFGGSWGSTLALAYAMEHPDRVTELVLRGIFLLREKEIDWMYEGKGANYVFPEDWADYENVIPPEERDNYVNAYGRRLRGELGEAEMLKASKAWSIWEGRIVKLVQDPIETLASSFGDEHFALAFARIENHYFTNKGFFPRDGYLLEPQNIAKLKNIPISIVQGRYDIVCPAISAYDLAKAATHAEIKYVLAGHSSFEKEIIKELVHATDKYKNNH